MKIKSLLKKLVAAVIVIAIVGTGTYFLIQNKKKENAQALEESNRTAAEEGETAFAVNVTQAVAGQINNYLELNGDVNATTTVDILPDTSGKLSRRLVDVGTVVRKDQVIAEVDPSRPGMQFAVSPVKAPISGTITAVTAQIGSTVSPGMSIARVSRMDDLKITTQVAERFISQMKPGLRALLRFPAYPEERFTALVSEVSPVVDPQTRTIEVTLKLTEKDSRIKAGMFSELKIITETKEGIVKIPARCLVKRYGGYYVFVVKDDETVEMRKVNPGIEIDNKLEITQGLEPGEKIVIRGQTLLEDKTRVRVIEEIQPLTADDIVE